MTEDERRLLVIFLRLPLDQAERAGHWGISQETRTKSSRISQLELVVKTVFTHRYTRIPNTPRKKSERTWCQLLASWRQIIMEQYL